MSARPKLFVSYSHKDSEWLERLQVALKPLTMNNAIDLWDDSLLGAGDLWDNKIENALAGANVGVLLVSPDFMASDYITAKEEKMLLDASEKEDVLILIVHVGRTHMSDRLKAIQAINDPTRPLKAMSESEVDDVFYNLVERIKLAIPEGRSSEPANFRQAAKQSIAPARLIKLSVQDTGHDGSGTVRILNFEQEQITLGRDARNDVHLAEPTNQASKKHAKIYCEDDQFFITDLDSTNGTRINEAERPVTPFEPTELHDGDTITVGSFTIHVIIPPLVDPNDTDEDRTVYSECFDNPYLKDVENLVGSLRLIGEKYAKEPTRQNMKALEQALGEAIEKDAFDAYKTIGSVLLTSQNNAGKDS